MKTLLWCVALLFCLTSCAKTGPAWDHAFPQVSGETAIYQLDTAPYPHESRAEGFKSYTAAEHYADNTVGVYIPEGLNKKAPVNYIVYFHGHGNDVRQAMESFQLREQVLASGKNAIFVFPQGPYRASDSGLGRLEEEGALRNLLEDVTNQLVADHRLKTTAIGSVVLTGHSGAYRGIYLCLMHGGMEQEVSEVYLLDASYGGLEEFAAWIERNPDKRFISIFTDHLKDENEKIMGMLDQAGVEYVLTDEDNAFDYVVETSPRLFVHLTRSNHNEAVKYLQEYLTSSSLPNIQ